MLNGKINFLCIESYSHSSLFFRKRITYIYAHYMETVAKTFNIFSFQFWNSRTKFENDTNRSEIKLALSWEMYGSLELS